MTQTDAAADIKNRLSALLGTLDHVTETVMPAVVTWLDTGPANADLCELLAVIDRYALGFGGLAHAIKLRLDGKA